MFKPIIKIGKEKKHNAQPKPIPRELEVIGLKERKTSESEQKNNSGFKKMIYGSEMLKHSINKPNAEEQKNGSNRDNYSFTSSALNDFFSRYPEPTKIKPNMINPKTTQPQLLKPQPLLNETQGCYKLLLQKQDQLVKQKDLNSNFFTHINKNHTDSCFLKAFESNKRVYKESCNIEESIINLTETHPPEPLNQTSENRFNNFTRFTALNNKIADNKIEFYHPLQRTTDDDKISPSKGFSFKTIKKIEILTNDSARYHHPYTQLMSFLNSYFIDDITDIERIRSLSVKELVILYKLLCKTRNKIKHSPIDNPTGFKEELFQKAKIFFTGDSAKINSFFPTPKKKFAFNMVKGILINKLSKNGKTKKEKKEIFFNHYFTSREEYMILSNKDKKDLYDSITNYMEGKIFISMRFEEFARDMSLALKEFEPYVKKYYFDEKLKKINQFLCKLKSMNVKDLISAEFGQLRLPYNHQSILNCKQDFINNFGYFLKDV